MPGAITEGDTREKALSEMRGVMEVWIDLAREYGEAPLIESPQVIAEEVAAVLQTRDDAGWDHSIEMTMLAPAELVLA